MQGNRGHGNVGGVEKDLSRGKMGVQGMGPDGFCVCPVCGERVSHKRRVPCYEMKCPKCGIQMVREKS